MPQDLDYGRPPVLKKRRILAFFAGATIVYPLAMVMVLYLTWLPARMALGHSPQPMVDSYSNTSILGTSLTYFGLIVSPFVAVIAMVLNILYIRRSRMSLARNAVQMIALLAIWIGVVALLAWDPFKALAWLMD